MKTRVLFLISRFLDGGIDTVLVEYLRHFNAQCYDVSFAIGMRMEDMEVHLSKIPASVHVSHLVSSSRLTALRRQKIRQKLPKHLRLFDEICLNPIRRLQVRHRLNRLIRRHDVVVDFDGMFSSFLKGTSVRTIGFHHFSLTAHSKRLARRFAAYDHVVVISKAMQDEFQACYPSLHNKVHCIYNGMDIAELTQRAEADYKIPLPNTRFLLAVERLEESQKDITTLLHAYAQYANNTPVAIPLLILGEGKSRTELEQLTRELNLTERVHFGGFIPNPIPYIKQCAALLHSAKFEGLPTVLIEALLLDKPIVATDCPTGPREILDNGQAGRLVPMGNASAMAAAIQEVLQEGSQETPQETTNRHARHEHKRLFDIHNSIKELEKLWQ